MKNNTLHLEILFFLTVLLVVICVFTFPDPGRAAKAQYELRPGFSGNPPYTGFDLLKMSDIIVYEDGTAKAKGSKKIENQPEGDVTTANGTVSYLFLGEYDKKTKVLNGTLKSLVKKTLYSTEENYTYSRVQVLFEGVLEAKLTEADYMEGTVTGEQAIRQTYMPHPEDETGFIQKPDNTTTGYTFTFWAWSDEPMQANPVQEGYDSPDSKYKLEGMVGEIEVLLPGESEWRAGKPDLELTGGTKIRTKEDSSAILRCADGSSLIIKPETRVKTAVIKREFKLIDGDVWINAEKMIRTGSMAIEMNQAVAGIKGTTLVVSERDGASWLRVIEGVVEFTAKADGKKVTVKAGEEVYATGPGLQPVKKFDVAAEKKDWEKIISGMPHADDTKTQPGETGASPATKGLDTLTIAGIAGIATVILVAGIAITFRKKNK